MVPSGVCTAPSTILNDFHSDRPTAKEAAAEFPQFSRLPVEILLAIWKCTLQRHRLIGITVLDESEDDDEPPLYTARNSLGNTISGERYRLLVTTNHRLTPLFWVNRQARQAALEFYRVHISYDFNAYGERLCLYLNPEFDILHLRPEGAPGILVDFVHDVKAYDPLGLGILNMAIGTGKPRSLSLPMDPSYSEPQAVSVFKATLANLRRVFFHQAVEADTRHMWESLELEEIRYNRSYPLNSSSETFDLIESDPRPIDGDLNPISVGWDPRSMLYLWREMERNFRVHRSRPVEYQFLITSPTFGRSDNMDIVTRADVNTYLQREDEFWRSKWAEGGIYQRMGVFTNPDTPDALKKASMPVVGFWLFPVDAFGDVPELEGPFKDIEWETKMVADMTKHWPQLGVFRLTD